MGRSALHVLVAALLLVVGSLTWCVPAALAQEDPQRWLYDDNDAFSQLSSAARTALQERFGKKADHLFPQSQGLTVAGLASLQSPLQVLGGFGALAAPLNVLVNNPALDSAQFTQSETSLVLGAGRTVVAAYNDSGSLVEQTSLHFDGFSRSVDGGASWMDGGSVRNRAFGSAGDPVLARDDVSETIYLCTLWYNGSGLNVFRSTDNGQTFNTPVNAMPGFLQASGGADFLDKPWITVDNAAGPGRGNVYVVARNFPPASGAARGGIVFSRSTDGGRTFGPAPGLLLAPQGSQNVQGAWVTVGPDHGVYVFWYDQNFSPPRIQMRKSTDQGVTFGSPVTVAALAALPPGLSNGNLGLEFRTNSFPQALVNPVNGHVYVVYNDNPPGVDRGDIFLVRSTDGGATWSAPQRVNNDPTIRDQWQPALAVTPDGTRLFVGFYDRRLDLANRLIDTFGAIADLSGGTVSFGPSFRITNQSFPAVFGVDPVVNATYMGDYDQAVADNSQFYYTWADNRLPQPNVPTRPRQPDVRFTRVPVTGPDAAPALIIAGVVVSGGNGNGEIDANECNELILPIQNLGSGPATGVTATLSTTTPGVRITQPNLVYGDVPIGGTATGAAPPAFMISTAPSFACGTPIELTLTLTYAEGSDVKTISVPTPGANYRIASSQNAVIVPGVTDIGNHGDDVTTRITLPFPYTLYDQTFTAANISSNGNIQFVSNNTSFSNVALPTNAFNYAILAHWDDLLTSGPGNGVFTSISGTAPNRVFNIEWRAVYFSASGRADFEVRLYEGQQRFDIIYGTVSQNGASATIGVQRDTGSLFSQYAFNLPGSVFPGLQLIFDLPPCQDGGGECP